MQKLVFRNANGIELDLTSGDYGITEWEGFSAVDLNVQSQQVPFQDGSVYLDGLLGERELSVTVAMQDKNNLEKRYQLRRQMISVLNPKLGEGVLIYTNDYISKQIHCVAQMPVFENHNSNDSGTPKASCSFTACNPYWEDLEDTEIIVYDERKTIINNGDIPCGVKIRLVNEGARDIKINNTNTGKQIRIFEDYYRSEPVYINTNVGEKEIIEKKQYLKLRTIQGTFNKIKYFEDSQDFVVVGQNGYILTSKDGINYDFIYVEQLVGQILVDVTYCSRHNFYCIVGGKVETIKLEQGVLVKTGTYTPEQPLKSVAYFEKTDSFYCVGENGFICKYVYNEEYDLWLLETITSFTNKTLYGIVSANVISNHNPSLIVVGEDGVIFRSYNGTEWTDISSALITDDIKQIIYTDFSERRSENESYFIRTDDKIYKSNQYGTDWELYKDLTGYTILNMDLYEYNLIITTAEKIFINNIRIPTEWKEMYVPNNLAGNFIGCAYSRELGIFVFFTQYGMKCVNASNTLLPNAWENNIGVIFGSVAGICESKDKLFAVTESGNIYKSKDGNNWEQISITNGINNYYGICYSKKLDLLVAVGYSEYSHNSIITSSDGINWTVRSTDEQALRSIVYAEEGASPMFVAVGDNGLVKISVDGINWETYSSGHSLKCIIYAYYGEGINHYVAGGADGYILSSYDAVNWTERANYNGNINGIAYSKMYNLFVAVGSTEGFIISENITDWNVRAFGDISFLKSIVFSEEEGYFEMAGNLETVQSIDIIGFNSVPMSIALQAVFYSKLFGTFFYGGNNGTVFSKGTQENINRAEYLSKDSDLNFNLDVGENIINTSTREGKTTMKLTYRQKYLGV